MIAGKKSGGKPPAKAMGKSTDDERDDSLETIDDDLDQDEFADTDSASGDDDVGPDIEEFDDDIVDDDSDESAEKIDEVVEMTSKEQSARSLEVRRAIEARMDKKKLAEDIDYLDMDFDD